MGTEFSFVPRVDIGTIQSHFATDRRPKSHQQPGERGLASRRGADHREEFSGLKRELDAPQDRIRRLTRRWWRPRRELFDRKNAAWSG